MQQRSSGEKVFTILNVFLIGVFGLLSLYPFLYTLSISLSPPAEVNAGGLHLYPKQVTLTAYKMLLANASIIKGYANTLFRTVVGTALTLVVTCLCAYPLSKRHLPWRKSVTFFVLFTMLFNGGIVPTYLVIKNLGLIDSLWVYVLPMLTTAFNVIVVKNFFQSIPESLAESAAVDGASELRTLFQIYVPLSRPILATVTLWTAVAHWNMWFDALIYVNSEDKQVLQMFLRRVAIDDSTQLIQRGAASPDMANLTPETLKAATVVITILPFLILYPFFQKHVVKGIVFGGVKE